ncbi:16S rRNA (guanine(966)-N(2))-methyltransferase RsmD [Mesomycoplasma lagogenitalium]|uniref:16S rRNA (Guanine(966)-N(2))-methyltransferase RsmD n=1 Tax=Mesomycoplasma lagogenitalium TaxID=171286 RepID=A0ABY8LVI0_9BACT|nr:16S rRNA (guanine(966)-N(2))-methyltransferase RsmD [Mesomycoplasma lagogenitalium]WGI36538.1 16S rRNA (guanine(966)-N(2))-methyltransferase RsmD [Mesomycoplasma lagogenitalium]
MIRIISGIFKGRRIEEPDLTVVRPTTDKIREAIFSSIQFEIENATVLDLFGGSGAISIEFISRQAKEVDLSEKNNKVFNIIKKNTEQLKIKNLNLYNIDALKMIELKKEKKYDFIFLDPPYDNQQLLLDSLEKIQEFDILSDDGKIIIETNIDNLEFNAKFKLLKLKKYRKTFIYFLGK